jgi:hypothetical protein
VIEECNLIRSSMSGHLIKAIKWNENLLDLMSRAENRYRELRVQVTKVPTYILVLFNHGL